MWHVHVLGAACATYGCSLWDIGLHEKLAKAAADLREGVPGQRGALSLRQPAGQL